MNRCPACGGVALDGHITCGRFECDEHGQRRARAGAQPKLAIAPKSELPVMARDLGDKLNTDVRRAVQHYAEMSAVGGVAPVYQYATALGVLSWALAQVAHGYGVTPEEVGNTVREDCERLFADIARDRGKH
jgi:hypothetical protein